MEEIISDLKAIHKDVLEDYKLKFDEITANPEIILRHIHDTVIVRYISSGKCDKLMFTYVHLYRNSIIVTVLVLVRYQYGMYCLCVCHLFSVVPYRSVM